MPTVHLAPAVAGPLAEASLDFGLRRPEGRVKAPLADNSPTQAVRSVWEPKQGSESFMGTSSPTTSRQPVRNDDEIPLGGLAEHYSDLDAPGPKVGMHAQPSEDALLRRDKRSSLLQSQVNEQAEQLRVAQDQLSSLAETLQEQAAQSSSKEEMRRLHEAQSAALAELRGNFERTMDTMESNVNQQMLQTQRRLQTMDATMSRAQENLIEKTEGRFLEFMSEAESERARLWHQMSVLFPRFLANESKAPMTMSEARVFAIDVRLDSVEDGIVKLMSRDEDEKKRSGRRSSSCLRPEDPQEQSDPLPAMEKLKAPQAFQKDRAPHQLPTQGRPSLGGKLRTALLLASPRRSAAAPARNASPELPGRVSHIPDLGAEVSSPELEGLELQVEFGPTPRATCLSQPLAGLDLSMDDALLEVMGEARNDAEDAKLVRSLNQKGKRWRMGDAAVGRVILGQETRPGTARVRGQWLGTLCRDTEA
ncbi:unnamed protein product [Effrenium voratum]|nr:unnamed protein product [Effrenium voratum]